MVRAIPIVVASISLIALQLRLAARADVSVRGDSGLNSKVNGRRDGSCKSGVCRISGGRRGGRKDKILFHRLSELDTRGDRIKKIKLNVGARKTKSVIVGVTSRSGSYLTSPFVLSGKADLILLSPGGVQVNGATFKNISHLSLAATSHFKMGDGVFDVFNTTSDQLSSFSLSDETSLSERADDLLINLSSASMVNDHGKSVQGSIKISDQLSVDSDLLVVAKQPIKVKHAQLDVSGDLHLDSRLPDVVDIRAKSDIPERKKRQNMILLSNIDANVSGDVVVQSESGVSDRSYGGLLVRGSQLTVDGEFVASTHASSQSRFHDSHGMKFENGTAVHAESIDLTGRGGNSSRRQGNEGIWVDDSEFIADQDLSFRGLGGDGRNLVDGVVLLNSNLHSKNGRLLIEGQGGNNAEINMDGIKLRDAVRLSAASEISLHGTAGHSRSPNGGAGIYASTNKKQRASIDAGRVVMVGVGANRAQDSAWPKKVNKNVMHTTGVDLNNLDIHATGAVKIKGKGGYGDQDLDGIALRNVTIQSGGRLKLEGVTGYGDQMERSNGVYLDQVDLSAEKTKIIGRHRSNKNAPVGKILDGIFIENSRIDAGRRFEVFGMPAKSGKIKNSTGIWVNNSDIVADSMSLSGISQEFYEFMMGQVSIDSLDDRSQQSEDISRKNIGLWLKDSNVIARDGALHVTGVGGVGREKAHGVWLTKSTNLTANNGDLLINGVAGIGTSEMYGVFIDASHLYSDSNIEAIGDSSSSRENGMNNIGIKFINDSSLLAENIILDGKGGYVSQGGKILDGVSIEKTDISANSELHITGYAGYGSNISRSNGISLNKGSDLTAGSVVLMGYGHKEQEFVDQLTDQMVVTDQINQKSKNHGVSIRSALISSENDLQIEGVAGRGQELLDGVHIRKSHLVAGDGMTIRGKGSDDVDGKIKYSDGIYSVDSTFESNGLINLFGKGAAGKKLSRNYGVDLVGMNIHASDVRIKGKGGSASKKSVYSSGVLLDDTNLQAFNAVVIKGLSGYAGKLERSNGVDLEDSHLSGDLIKISGSPNPVDQSDVSGLYNQGIHIINSQLNANNRLLLRGIGGPGIESLDGLDIRNSELTSGRSLRMFGQGGRGDDIKSSTGMYIADQSKIQGPRLTMQGKGGFSTITESFDREGTYLNDGIVVIESTIRSVNSDPELLTSESGSKLFIDGQGGEIIGDSFDGGDLNSGVVFWDATLFADGPTIIEGLAGKPPQGNLNTGVEIGGNSEINFVSQLTNEDVDVVIRGKAYSGNNKNTAVIIKDSELHSSLDVIIVGEGAPNSTGDLNQGVRLKNGLVQVGDMSSSSTTTAESEVPPWLAVVDQPVDSARDLTIKGLGGQGLQNNSGISMKNTDLIVDGNIILEGNIQDQQWQDNPSVYLNGSFISAGENLVVDADYDAQIFSSKLDAGQDILVRANTLQLFDVSLNALGAVSLQSQDVMTDSAELTAGRADDSTDSDSASEADSDVRASISSVLSTRTLTFDEIEQLLLNQEQLSMERLSKDLGLEKVQPMGLREIQEMLQWSIQQHRN